MTFEKCQPHGCYPLLTTLLLTVIFRKLNKVFLLPSKERNVDHQDEKVFGQNQSFLDRISRPRSNHLGVPCSHICEAYHVLVCTWLFPRENTEGIIISGSIVVYTERKQRARLQG